MILVSFDDCKIRAKAKPIRFKKEIVATKLSQPFLLRPTDSNFYYKYVLFE